MDTSNTELTPGASPEPDAQSAGLADRSHIPSAERVQQTLAEKGATPEQIATVVWLVQHARERGFRNYAELGKAVGYGASTISRVLRGLYGAQLGDFVAEIEAYRSLDRERTRFGGPVFVESLSVVQAVKDTCDLVRASQSIGLIWGPNQSGKTKAVSFYRDQNNHGRTIYVRMPVGGGTRVFLSALAKAAGVSDHGFVEAIRERLWRYFNPSILLIVDEVHQCLIGRTLKTTTVETIRALHDETGCGVVLIGTDVLPKMFEDPRFREFLGQIANRGVIKRRIPSAPSRADVTKLCKAYGFDVPTGEARKVVFEIANNHGIGRLSKVFAMARRYATGKREAINWNHFLVSVATLKAWAEGLVEEDQEGGGN